MSDPGRLDTPRALLPLAELAGVGWTGSPPSSWVSSALRGLQVTLGLVLAPQVH